MWQCPRRPDAIEYDNEAWQRMANRGDYMRDGQWRKGFALLSRQVFDLQISSCADKFKDF